MTWYSYKERSVRLLIDMTPDDIADGTNTPATSPMALAADRALRALGLDAGPGREWHAEWEPYRAFCEPEGFTVRRCRDGADEVVCRVPVHLVDSEAYYFASEFDDWRRAEWWGDGDDDPPDCPGPIAFALELPLTLE